MINVCLVLNNKLNIKQINGGPMKNKYSLRITLILFIFITSCMEEAIVEQQIGNDFAVNSTLSKGSYLSTVQLDSSVQKEKKEKVKRLRKEFEKPYVIIEKPENILLQKLREKFLNYSQLSKYSKYGALPVQSTASITIEVDVWAFETYYNSPGFSLAISPKFDWLTNNSYISLLRNTYGFSHFMTVRDFIPIAESNGYPLSNIIAGVDAHFPQQVINSYNQSDTRGPCGFYYADEPDHVPLSFFNGLGQQIIPYSAIDSVNKFVNYIRGKYPPPNSKIVIGETTVNSVTKFDEIVDFVTITWYGDPINLWLFLSTDQRDRWTEFNSFGDKFNYLWISGASDRGEMDRLMGHARNMNKNSIWLYAGENGVSNESYWDAIYEFSYYAFIHSFLTRKERKYICVYSYNGYGDPMELTSWDLTDIVDTGEFRFLSN